MTAAAASHVFCILLAGAVFFVVGLCAGRCISRWIPPPSVAEAPTRAQHKHRSPSPSDSEDRRDDGPSGAEQGNARPRKSREREHRHHREKRRASPVPVFAAGESSDSTDDSGDFTFEGVANPLVMREVLALALARKPGKQRRP